MKLYYSKNLNPRVAVAVAKYLKSPVEFIKASPRHPANEEAFKQINPNALVPVLVEDNQTLFETDAIACRLSEIAKSDFWAGGEHLAHTIQWLSWSAAHFTQIGGTYYFENIIRPLYMKQPPDEAAIENVRDDFHRYAKVLDDVLSKRDWLVNNRMSYADFRVATALPFAEKAKLPIENYPNILKWHARLNEIDAWRDPFAGFN